MRHRADAFGAPPRRLRIGGDADRAGDVGGVAVARLDQPVIVAGRKEHHFFRLRRFDDQPRVGTDARASRQHAEVERLEHREGVVRPLDEQDRLPRLDFLSIIERVHDQLIPALGAELQNRNRFIDAAQVGVPLAEHLHRHPRAVFVFA